MCFLHLANIACVSYARRELFLWVFATCAQLAKISFACFKLGVVVCTWIEPIAQNITGNSSATFMFVVSVCLSVSNVVLIDHKHCHRVSFL